MQQLALLATPNSPPIQYWPKFLDRTQADTLLEQSLALDWQQNQIRMFGKTLAVPRLETMFGDSADYTYLYSNSVQFRAKPWPPFLAELRDKVEAQTNYRFQVTLGNYYRTGQDSNGYHADNEPSMGGMPAIASISLGATRSFKLKQKKGGQTHSINLSHGDLLLMLPGCQENWVHALPKTSRTCAIRVNWTFRPYAMG